MGKIIVFRKPEPRKLPVAYVSRPLVTSMNGYELKHRAFQRQSNQVLGWEKGERMKPMLSWCEIAARVLIIGVAAWALWEILKLA